MTMSVVRLQNLAWSASAPDVREFFSGLDIPPGGVHIIGGNDGECFVVFGSRESARQAVELDRRDLNGERVRLSHSSMDEMQDVIAVAKGEKPAHRARSRSSSPYNRRKRASSPTHEPPSKYSDRRRDDERRSGGDKNRSRPYQSQDNNRGSSRYDGRNRQSSDRRSPNRSFNRSGSTDRSNKNDDWKRTEVKSLDTTTPLTPLMSEISLDRLRQDALKSLTDHQFSALQSALGLVTGPQTPQPSAPSSKGGEDGYKNLGSDGSSRSGNSSHYGNQVLDIGKHEFHNSSMSGNTSRFGGSTTGPGTSGSGSGASGSFNDHKNANHNWNMHGRGDSRGSVGINNQDRNNRNERPYQNSNAHSNNSDSGSSRFNNNWPQGPTARPDMLSMNRPNNMDRPPTNQSPLNRNPPPMSIRGGPMNNRDGSQQQQPMRRNQPGEMIDDAPGYHGTSNHRRSTDGPSNVDLSGGENPYLSPEPQHNNGDMNLRDGPKQTMKDRPVPLLPTPPMNVQDPRGMRFPGNNMGPSLSQNNMGPRLSQNNMSRMPSAGPRGPNIRPLLVPDSNIRPSSRFPRPNMGPAARPFAPQMGQSDGPPGPPIKPVIPVTDPCVVINRLPNDVTYKQLRGLFATHNLTPENIAICRGVDHLCSTKAFVKLDDIEATAKALNELQDMKLSGCIIQLEPCLLQQYSEADKRFSHTPFGHQNRPGGARADTDARSSRPLNSGVQDNRPRNPSGPSQDQDRRRSFDPPRKSDQSFNSQMRSDRDDRSIKKPTDQDIRPPRRDMDHRSDRPGDVDRRDRVRVDDRPDTRRDDRNTRTDGRSDRRGSHSERRRSRSPYNTKFDSVNSRTSSREGNRDPPNTRRLSTDKSAPVPLKPADMCLVITSLPPKTSASDMKEQLLNNMQYNPAYVEMTSESDYKSLMSSARQVFNQTVQINSITKRQMAEYTMEHRKSLPTEHIIQLCGLPFDATVGTVKTFLHPAEIKDTNIWLMKRQDGRCNGYGFVKAYAERDVTEALKHDRGYIGKRYVNIKIVNEERMKSMIETSNKADDGSTSSTADTDVLLRLSNIRYDVREDQVETFFREFEPIRGSVKIVSFNGMPTGRGTIKFVTAESAEAAKQELDGADLNGRPIRITLATNTNTI